ncbi:hypothetical protein CI102_1837 [Trichoderma harzianum]|nr:hypothetical protein CI102_1837 [Trichoderma harzianum]
MSSSEAIHQCVFIHPKPEKLDQADEPGSLVWAVHERDVSAGEPMIVVWEIYENAAARVAHRQNPVHIEQVRVLTEDVLFARPAEIMPLNHLAGSLGPGLKKV